MSRGQASFDSSASHALETKAPAPYQLESCRVSSEPTDSAERALNQPRNCFFFGV